MSKVLLTLSFIIICSIVFLFHSGFFNKEITCELNELPINSSIIGMTRSDIIKKLGKPTKSAILIKGFDEYNYKFQKKSYTIVLHYTKVESSYYLSSFKCIKSQARLELSNYVIWH